MGRKGEVAEDAVAWIALRGARGLSDAAARRAVELLGSAEAMLAASATMLDAAGLSPAARSGVRKARRDDARAEAERIAALDARLVAYRDVEYPALLRELPDAPLYLIVRGDELDDGPAVALVGARHATPYGLDVAARFGEELAQAGVTVVSGLARGVDGAAHRGALRGGGRTVAVFGAGIDVIYPPEHADLAAEVAASGTLVTELPCGTPPLAEHFPSRNRIIAGMTHGTLVVEAAQQSGSQITARLALDQGREVFAVPGRIDSPLSAGTHRLIQEGAKLVGSIEDIVAELGPALRARAPQRISAHVGVDPIAEPVAQDEPLLPLLAGGPLAADELIRRSGLAPASVLARILDLELRGILVQLPGKHFQLANRP
ncbi:MAG TPA: DNA-processing protein DprA [Candidatus Binatia bacterium]|jgi:DNA processing protein